MKGYTPPYNNLNRVYTPVIIMTYYKTLPEKSRRYRARLRMKAILKLANGKDPCCAICGCPVSYTHLTLPTTPYV